MEQNTQTIIAIGERAHLDNCQSFAQEQVILRNYFCKLIQEHPNRFNFLADLPYYDVFCYTKGMVRCEEFHISPYSGKFSLVIQAFREIQGRPMDEWTKIALWIVQNHNNQYSPFGNTRTYANWRIALHKFSDPIHIAEFADELERLYQAKMRAEVECQAIKERVDQLNKGKVPESAEVRERMIEELEKKAGWPD